MRRWLRKVLVRLRLWRTWAKLRFLFTGDCGLACGVTTFRKLDDTPFQQFVPEADCPIHDIFPMKATYCGLEREFNYYLDNQDDLVKRYSGKVVVIKDQSVIGVFNSELEAVDETAKEHELGTFLVQRCEPGSESYTVTYHLGGGLT